VHRYEPSGALHGVMRVRAFTQDDAHIFCTEDQIMDEAMKVNDLIMSIYKDFGFEDVVVKLSTRPEKRVGSDDAWDKAEAALGRVLDVLTERGMKTGINPGEGAFYGPKLEYTLRDAIGRAEAAGAPWLADAELWLYRGAMADWPLDEIDLAVPLSPHEVLRRRRAIFRHETQKDQALFLGEDRREFWQRTEDRSRRLAQAYNALGLAEYEAIEAFKRYAPADLLKSGAF
jgi:hypothetical protein